MKTKSWIKLLTLLDLSPFWFQRSIWWLVSLSVVRCSADYVLTLNHGKLKACFTGIVILSGKYKFEAWKENPEMIPKHPMYFEVHVRFYIE